jgi:hypothetical protein
MKAQPDCVKLRATVPFRETAVLVAILAALGGQLVGCGGEVTGAAPAAPHDGRNTATTQLAEIRDGQRTPADGSSPVSAMGGQPAQALAHAVTVQGLTAEQRETLQLAFAGHPGAARDLPHAADRVVFRSRWNRFVALTGVPGADATGERVALARQLDAGLDTRIERHEIRYSEAVSIKAALLEVLDPSSVRRHQALAAWRKNIPAQTSSSGPNGRIWTAQERAEEFERLKATAVAEWEAQPAEERDPEELRQYLLHLSESILEPP